MDQEVEEPGWRQLANVDHSRRSTKKRRVSATQSELSRPTRGNEDVAYASGLLKRCVKKRVHRKGKFIESTGVYVDVERFPWKTGPILRLNEYGCPIAVYLYLRFLLEAAILCLLLGLISVPILIDSVWRNQRRDQCRAEYSRLVRVDNVALSLASLTLSDAEAQEMRECGYDAVGSGESIRGELPRVTLASSPLLPSIGTCMEYIHTQHSNFTSAQLIPTPGFFPFGQLRSDAAMCWGGSAGLLPGNGNGLFFWSTFLMTVLLIGFLLRMRRMQRYGQMNFHVRGSPTAADYAVMIRGLDVVEYDDADGMPDLERRLRVDLARLGFEQEDINHIELGRDCKREIFQLTMLASLLARKEELVFQLAEQRSKLALYSEPRGMSHANRKVKELETTEASIASVNEKLGATRSELKRLMREKHWTTGHAFICFEKESTRNRFLSIFTTRPRSLDEQTIWEAAKDIAYGPERYLRRHWKEEQPNKLSPPMQAAGWRKIIVKHAPEPSDIYWENLDVPTDTRRRLRYRSWLLLFALILLCAVLMYLATVIIIMHYQYQTHYLKQNEDNQNATLEVTFQGLGIIVLSTVITLVVNVLLLVVADKVTHAEKHSTRSTYERALFTRLLVAYVLNTVVVPIFVSILTLYDPIERTLTFYIAGMTQMWMESGGVVAQAVLLMVSSAFATDGLRVFQIGPLFQRYVLGRYFTSSQIKLNQRWRPPPMLLGAMHAETFRQLALGFIYAPIYPPSFLITALCLIISFYATKYGLANFYARPPLVGGHMMKRIRSAMLSLVLVYVLVSMFVAYSMEPEGFYTRDLPAYMAIVAMWLALLAISPVLSRSRYFSTKFAASEATRKDAANFSDVSLEFGIILDRYECPAASSRKSEKELESTAFAQVRGYLDQAGIHARTSSISSSDGDETLAQPNAARDALQSTPDLDAINDKDYYREIAARIKGTPVAPPRAQAMTADAATTDPVIRHLDGALESLNEVLVGLGAAAPISHQVDMKLLEQQACNERSKRIAARQTRRSAGAHQTPQRLCRTAQEGAAAASPSSVDSATGATPLQGWPVSAHHV